MNHSKNEQLMARKAAATPRGVGVMGTFFAERALGAELWDAEGRRFIDFAGGIAVMNVGHGHPKVVAALQAQLERFTHTCYQVVPYESYITLAETLNQLTPGKHAKKTALFSTGAEAVENAIKIARSYTRRSGVIAFGGAFHGRSMFAVSLTGKVQPYKAGFGPFPPEIYHAPFPCHCASLDEVKKAVETKSAVLLDARPLDAYDKGHLPGAKSRFWMKDIVPAGQPDAGSFRSEAELKVELEAMGVTAATPVIVYCNTGQQASALFYTLRYRLGYAYVRLYNGSWLEWSITPGLPKEVTPQVAS